MIEWQPYKTAPKDKCRFIAWDDELGCPLYTMRWNGSHFVTDCERWSGSFSHWMPQLTAPPQDDSDETD